MTIVTTAEAQAHLPELLDKVVAGQEIVISRDDEPIAHLVPAPKKKPRPVFGSCRGMIKVLREDDEHLDHFKEYMP